MESGIYKIVNTATGKCYVGSAKNFTKRWARHFKDLRNGAHSSIKLQRSYDKHGETVFIPQIIEELEYSKDQIIEREDYWMARLDSKSNGYNIASASFGDVLSNHPNRTEIIKKISNSINDNISNMTQHERNEKFGQPGKLNGMFGRTHTEETITKINNNRTSWANVHKGTPLHELLGNEVADKIKKSVSTANKNNKYWLGKIHTEETKEKISNSKKGKKASPEAIELNRQAQLRRWANIRANNKLPSITVDGVNYNSIKTASEILGVSVKTLRNRANNPNFKNVIIHSELT